jgi:hypothetical protein
LIPLFFLRIVVTALEKFVKLNLSSLLNISYSRYSCPTTSDIVLYAGQEKEELRVGNLLLTKREIYKEVEEPGETTEEIVNFLLNSSAKSEKIQSNI